jgi:hypothetical protein
MNILLYIMILIASILVLVIVLKGFALYIWWRKGNKVEKYNNAGHRFFDRAK